MEIGNHELNKRVKKALLCRILKFLSENFELFGGLVHVYVTGLALEATRSGPEQCLRSEANVSENFDSLW